MNKLFSSSRNSADCLPVSGGGFGIGFPAEMKIRSLRWQINLFNLT